LKQGKKYFIIEQQQKKSSPEKLLIQNTTPNWTEHLLKGIKSLFGSSRLTP
jgi:hypothetical protein